MFHSAHKDVLPIALLLQSDSAETKIASVPSSCSESTDDGCDSEQKERRNRQSTRSPKIKVGFLSR
jgi:hypothetical protein